jgi:hypothetical protein
MNDFTKEELSDLEYALVEYGECESTNVTKLSDKLQSMIENYCEHENSGEGYNCTECRDCGARW